MISLSPLAAYDEWAPTYDNDPNPLLALEERVLRPQLKLGREVRVLDLATGTGRWLQYAKGCGAKAVGMDISGGMLRGAAAKPGLRGRVAQADLSALPFIDECADIAILSFSLSYINNAAAAFRECARVARHVVVSDMHPDAMAAGWTRSFRNGQRSFHIEHIQRTIPEVVSAAREAQLTLLWSAEPRFGNPEYPLFEAAGRRGTFDRVCQVPALWTSIWSRA
jgi:ubiquinone/menaquinone biosynthesis C-methylase UbiE